MADQQDETGTEGPETAAAGQVQATLAIHRQYIKDLSFENPNAPAAYDLFAEEGPEIEVNVEMNVVELSASIHEVVVAISAKATKDGMTAFVVELQYGGVATVGEGASPRQVEQILLIEVPRHLFPFMRAIIANTTRDGGFPPLLLNPIDFGQVYRDRKAAAPAPAEAVV